MNEERIATASVSTGLAMTEGERTPELIGAEVRMYVEAGRRITLLCGIEIGRRLCEAKDMLQHGEWLPWLEKETGFSTSSAQRYMQVFKEYGAAQQSLFGPVANCPTLGNLSITNALRLLAVPEEERESFAQELNKQIKEAEAAKAEHEKEIRELAVKAEAAEKAGAESKQLRAQIKDLQGQLTLASPEVAAFKAAFDRAQAELVTMLKTLRKVEDAEVKAKLSTAARTVLSNFAGQIEG